MDNDLMARRLRPPSQPTSQNGLPQQPQQPPAPWDVPLTEDGWFAPAQSQPPQNDPPFAPPDPAARADVPWDRPAPDVWPPTEAVGTDYQQTWSAQGGPAAAQESQPQWPEAGEMSDGAPWDRPANEQSIDPDDAMAPVVGDVNAPAGVWHEWSNQGVAGGYANGDRNGHTTGSLTASTPEPMTVAAHSDQPRGSDEPRSDAWGDGSSAGDGPSLPEWPAEDDLAPPTSSRGPVMPEDSWPVTPQEAPPPPSSASTPGPAPADEPQPEMSAESPAPPEPVAAPPAVTPVVTSAQFVPAPAGSPQNMVLRIELAIVDESQRANPVDAAKRVGPEADVRTPEYNPRTHVDRAPMPEPEYEWDAPLPAPDQRGQRPTEQRAHTQPLDVAPPANAWQPAPTQPTQMDWGLPQIDDPQPRGSQPDQQGPWSTPSQTPQQQYRQQPTPPVAPPPTWALTEPTPPYTPEPPQFMPPAPPAPPAQPAPFEPRQPAWPPSQSSGPLHGLPAAPNVQPAPYQPAQHQYAAPYPAQPVQSVPSAPAAGSRARTAQAHPADQADLWFLANQPAATAAEDDAPPEGKSNSVLLAALTICFAVLVIVLVLVFIQLMTSLLR